LTILMLHFIAEVFDGLLGLMLILEEIDPCVSLIVINNHQTILLSS
jgi:hypothetical protein